MKSARGWFLCGWAVAACSAQTVPTSTRAETSAAGMLVASAETALVDAEAPPSAAPGPSSPTLGPAAMASPTEEAAFAAANAAFSQRLYGDAARSAGNLVLSPFGIESAVTLAWAGARGETARQIQRVLRATGTPEQSLGAIAGITSRIGRSTEGVVLKAADRVFAAKGLALDPTFVGLTQTFTGAPVVALDFHGAPEDSRRTINTWVSTATENHIKDLIPPGAIDARTRLLLADAIYFSGAWSTPFPKAATAEAPFFVSAASNKNVPTMRLTHVLPYAEASGVKILELPYLGGELSLVIVLPGAQDGLPAVESQLGRGKLAEWIASVAPRRVQVLLPSFHVSPPAPIPLGALLKAMGMALAFEPGKADFSGIGKPEAPGEGLFISEAFHRALVKVDEKGTEAAAATAVIMSPRMARPQKEPVAEFRADHPFVFVLRDVHSGVILFMGRIQDPTAG